MNVPAEQLVLALESSCDDTAVAVLRGGTEILSNVVQSQNATHAPYGGVVPELASRDHVAHVSRLMETAVREAGIRLDSLDGVAATYAPGLIGALLVGLQAGKSLAFALGKPFLGIHHLEGHLCAAFLTDEKIVYPHVALVVSGGHTSLYVARAFGDVRLIGSTRDDAAGEAFDKSAKVLGLGYPGGVRIDAGALGGDPNAIAFPRALRQKNSYEFSYSGLKTSVRVYLERHGRPDSDDAMRDFCASLNEAIVEPLVNKTFRLAEREKVSQIVVGGGVAANSRLRELFSAHGQAAGIHVVLPPKWLCTDNAAMIAAVAARRFASGEIHPLHLAPSATLPLGLA